MSEHTQGPWIPYVADGGHLVVGPDGYAVCALPSFGRGVDEQAANAELIAMAPDLLYRLQRLATHCRLFSFDDIRMTAAGLDAALGEAETLLDLLSEAGVTAGEKS